MRQKEVTIGGFCVLGAVVVLKGQETIIHLPNCTRYCEAQTHIDIDRLEMLWYDGERLRPGGMIPIVKPGTVWYIDPSRLLGPNKKPLITWEEARKEARPTS